MYHVSSIPTTDRLPLFKMTGEAEMGSLTLATFINSNPYKVPDRIKKLCSTAENVKRCHFTLYFTLFLSHRYDGKLLETVVGLAISTHIECFEVPRSLVFAQKNFLIYRKVFNLAKDKSINFDKRCTKTLRKKVCNAKTSKKVFQLDKN